MGKALCHKPVQGVAKGVTEQEQRPVFRAAGSQDAQIVRAPDLANIFELELLRKHKLPVQLGRGRVQHLMQVSPVGLLVGARLVKGMARQPKGFQQQVMAQSRPPVGPVRVQAQIHRLLLGGQRAKQVCVGHALPGQSLHKPVRAGGAGPLQALGAVLRVEGQLVGGNGKGEAPPFFLDIVLSQPQGAGGAAGLTFRQSRGPGVAVQGLGVKKPAIPAQGHAGLGRGVEDRRFQGRVRCNQLLAKGEMAGKIVRRVREQVPVGGAIRLDRFGQRGQVLVGRSGAGAQGEHSQPGNQAGQEKQSRKQQIRVLFHKRSFQRRKGKIDTRRGKSREDSFKTGRCPPTPPRAPSCTGRSTHPTPPGPLGVRRTLPPDRWVRRRWPPGPRGR